MNIFPSRISRFCVGARNASRPMVWIAGAVIVALVSSSSGPAWASLIGTTYSIRYDGHVISGGNTGVEGHTATHTFGIGLPHDLPATTHPPAPLLNANNLRVTETEAAQHVIITINSANVVGDVFANPLDPAFLVEFEGTFQWDDLLPLEKIAVTSIGIESFNSLPFPPPATSQVTGLGTPASPLNILLGIDPAVVAPNNNGFVKIHFQYMRMIIPEPSTTALTGIGIAGCLGLVRRRRAPRSAR